ncbi:MAG: hypothetical protein ACRETO_05510 [Gammaproteobacteria bacterium]
MTRPGLNLLVLLGLLPGIAVSAANVLPAADTAVAPAAASMAAPVTAQPQHAPAASTLQMPATSSDSDSSGMALPSRGMDMANVEHIYGAPLEKLAPVPVKGTRTHPPITRWVYPTFVVYFEYNHVVHAVTKAHPFKDSSGDHR